MKHNTIKVNFSKTVDELSLLGKVMRSYINLYGSLPHLDSHKVITHMWYGPSKDKNGQKIIKVEMEIGRP